MQGKRFVGFDSKRFRRGNFQALLGVGVTVEDVPKYCRKYDEIVTTAFEEAGIERRRPLYKSFDFSKLFFSKGYDLPERLFKELSEYVTFVDVYYSYFKKPASLESEKDDFIRVFHKEKTGIETVTPIKFLDMIEHSYPAICAWRYIGKYDAFNPEIFSDHFRSHPSNIWESLKGKPNFHVAYRGDQCNFLINAADVFVSAIERRILNKDLMLNRQIHEILRPEYEGKFETDFIGTKDLYDLSPSCRWTVDTSGRIMHPVYFVFPEGTAEFHRIFPGQDENTFLESSLFLDTLYHEATKEGGCIKIYDAGTDNAVIRNSDVFFHYGPAGKAKIELLRGLGYKNRVITASELVKQ